MSLTEEFEIGVTGGVTGGTVRGVLQRATDVPANGPMPAVLVCRGVLGLGEDADTLMEELADALCAAGLVVARFEHRCADLILDDFHAHSAAHDVEDAAATFRWLTARKDVDADRIGVLGYSLGAIAANALCAQNQSIDRLCLLAATTAADVCNRMVASNGSPGLINSEQMPAAYAPSLSAIDSRREVAVHDRRAGTLVVHGAADQFVPPEVSQEFVRALETGGRSVEHVLVARANHTFSRDEVRRAGIDHVCRFFAAMIGDRQPRTALATERA